MGKTLPHGWVEVPWQSLARAHRGVDSGTMELLPGAEVSYFRLDGNERRPFSEVPQGSLMVEEGDVLVPKSLTAFLAGRTFVARSLANGVGFVPPLFHVWRPLGGTVSPGWLAAFLRLPSVAQAAARRALNTSGKAQLSMDFLTELSVPLPALQEQVAILAILEETEALSAIRSHIEEEQGKLLPGLFREICGNPSELWQAATLTLAQIAYIAVGGTPSRADATNFGGGILWAKSGDLADADVWETQETLSEQGIQGSSARVLPEGTVLLGIYGGAVGRTGMLRVPAATNQAVAGIEPAVEDFPGPLLWAWLRVSAPRIRTLSRGSIQKNLNSRVVGDIPVPQFGSRARSRLLKAMEELEASRTVLIQQQRELEVLHASLHQMAFRGQLSRSGKRRAAPTVDRHFDAEIERANLLAAAERRGIWLKLSDRQQAVWKAALRMNGPFTHHALEREMAGGTHVLRGGALRSALDLLVKLGALIRDARADTDYWRRPDSDVDREVQV